jgi:hypothetical protein
VNAFRALSGDTRLLQALHRGDHGGRVHGTFARAINVETREGALWTLACRALGDGPGALVVDAAEFQPFGVACGDGVSLHGSTLMVGERLSIALDGVRPWECVLPRWPDDDSRVAANLARAKRELETRLAASAREQMPLAAHASARLAGHVDALVAALREHDVDALAERAANMIGLGPGLTPSGDDVLVGLLAALHVPGAPGEALRGIGLRIAKDAAGGTNAVSAAVLREAAQGRVREPIVVLLRALLHGGPDAVSRALGTVFAIGATSGADIATGVACALEAQLGTARWGGPRPRRASLAHGPVSAVGSPP